MILSIAFICGLTSNTYGIDYTFGYGLVFSLNELKSENISSYFPNIAPGGHSSYFYVEKSINEYLTISISPGAMNFEDNSSQFHAQYHIISTNFTMGTDLFPVFGIALGAVLQL